MQFVKIAEMSKFNDCKEEWNTLVLSMDHPSFFCTWEWIFTWWEHYGADYEPLILLIYKDAKMKGIFPLVLKKNGSRKTLYPSRLLSYAGSMDLYPDHLDIISNPENSEFCLNAVFDFLSDEFRNWDVFNLSLVNEGALYLSYLNKHKLKYRSEIRQKTAAPYIQLEGNFDHYLKSFDSKQRYERRRGQKELYGQFGFKYFSSDSSNFKEGLETLFHLHELRAKRKNITSTFTGIKMIEFHQALSERILHKDWLWLRFIGNEKKIISVFYGFGVGGHLFYYQLGIDPEWEQYGPGKAMFYEVIREACSKNYKEFDFLRGEEEYKYRWAQKKRDLFSVQVYNKTLQGAISKMAVGLKDMVKSVVK